MNGFFVLAQLFKSESGDRLRFSVVEELEIVNREISHGLAVAVTNYYRNRNQVAGGTKQDGGVLRGDFRSLGGKRKNEPKNENEKTNPISG